MEFLRFFDGILVYLLNLVFLLFLSLSLSLLSLLQSIGRANLSLMCPHLALRRTQWVSIVLESYHNTHAHTTSTCSRARTYLFSLSFPSFLTSVPPYRPLSSYLARSSYGYCLLRPQLRCLFNRWYVLSLSLSLSLINFVFRFEVRLSLRWGSIVFAHPSAWSHCRFVLSHLLKFSFFFQTHTRILRGASSVFSAHPSAWLNVFFFFIIFFLVFVIFFGLYFLEHSFFQLFILNFFLYFSFVFLSKSVHASPISFWFAHSTCRVRFVWHSEGRERWELWLARVYEFTRVCVCVCVCVCVYFIFRSRIRRSNRLFLNNPTLLSLLTLVVVVQISPSRFRLWPHATLPGWVFCSALAAGAGPLAWRERSSQIERECVYVYDY